MKKRIDPYFRIKGGPFTVQKAEFVIPMPDGSEDATEFQCRGIEYELKGGDLGTLKIIPEYYILDTDEGLHD